MKTHSYLYDEDGLGNSLSDEQEIPEIALPFAVGLLVVTTALVAVCAEFLVSSIDEMVASSGVSTTFIGQIILAIVGNAAEVYPSLI